MNMLVDGEWRTDAYETTDEDGAFDRQDTTFRDRVEDDPDARFQPEAGRYHLYACRACPWAHRILVARKLLGLEDAITVDYVDPFRGEDGWQFTPDKDGCTPDTVNGSDYLREVYVAADNDATCRVTVPVLWDKQEETIVNNESEEILRMLDTEFDDVADNDVDLYPEAIRTRSTGSSTTSTSHQQRRLPLWLREQPVGLRRGRRGTVRRAGPLGQRPRRPALPRRRRLTEADICLFTTLVRFDEVYHTHFMCNHKLIREYDNLWPYLRDLYQLPGVAETVNMDHITEHYYTTHPDVSPKRIVPMGPDPDFEADHDRDELPGDLPETLFPTA